MLLHALFYLPYALTCSYTLPFHTLSRLVGELRGPFGQDLAVRQSLTSSILFYSLLFSYTLAYILLHSQVSCEGPLGKTSLFDMAALSAADPALLFRTDMDMSVPKVWVVALFPCCCCCVVT